jgi:hypothetical protein
MTNAEDLWEELKALLRDVGAIFGDPASLWSERVLPRGEALSLRGWLAALEAAARALLLVMAARLPRPEPGPHVARRARPPAGAARPEPPHEDAPDTETPGSERWAGVVFRALPPKGGRPGRPAPARRFVSCRTLARRFEALIRVAEAPEAYARRLARRLYGSPALAARVLGPPPARGGRPPPWGDLPEAARTHAVAAAAAFDTG